MSEFKIISIKRIWISIFVAVCLLLINPVDITAAASGAALNAVPTVNDPDEPEHTEVTTKDGYIYVTTSRSVTVSLYTILGQLIVQQSVQPGTTRIKAPSRGVYILKAGSTTRRVTVN